MLKILHVLEGEEEWGASKGAFNLIYGLNQIGCINDTVTNFKGFGKESSYNLRRRGFLLNLKLKLLAIYESIFNLKILKKRNLLFSSGYLGITSYINRLARNYDIVHVHWSARRLVGLNVNKLTKPVVITARDMWHFTGGCHYTMGCTNYQNNCKQCPIFVFGINRLPEIHLNKKISNLMSDRLEVCVLSRWQEKSVIKSISDNKRIHVLGNAISHEFFQVECEWNYDESEDGVVLVGAFDLNANYKKSAESKDLLLGLAFRGWKIYSFGSSEISYLTEFEGYKHHGYIDSNSELIDLYRLASIFLLSSSEEAFGKTAVEALSQGTPVILIGESGASDLILNEYDGIQFKKSDGIEFMCEKIEEFIKAYPKRLYLKRRITSSLVSEPSRVALRYLNVYQDLIRKFSRHGKNNDDLM